MKKHCLRSRHDAAARSGFVIETDVAAWRVTYKESEQ
jgi:hypothetical protein